MRNNTLNNYVIPGTIRITLIDAESRETKLTLGIGASGHDLINFVEKELKIPKDEQYYFANIENFKSKIPIDEFEFLILLRMWGYENFREKPFSDEKKTMVMYVLNGKQYRAKFHLDRPDIPDIPDRPDKLYPTLPESGLATNLQ